MSGGYEDQRLNWLRDVVCSGLGASSSDFATLMRFQRTQSQVIQWLDRGAYGSSVVFFNHAAAVEEFTRKERYAHASKSMSKEAANALRESKEKEAAEVGCLPEHPDLLHLGIALVESTISRLYRNMRMQFHHISFPFITPSDSILLSHTSRPTADYGSPVSGCCL